MNKEELIDMAKQAGFERLGHDDCDYVCYPDDIEAFAKLVAEKAIKEVLAQPEQEFECVAMADYMELTEKYVALKAKEKNT